MALKFQSGGSAPQDMQKQIIALCQAAMQGDEKARKQVESIYKAAEGGDQQALQIASFMDQVMKEIQKQARSQKIGGKLDYIHRLRTGVARDEEVVYNKCGGKINKKVVKKAQHGVEIENTTKTQKHRKMYFCGGGKTFLGGKKQRYFGNSI